MFSINIYLLIVLGGLPVPLSSPSNLNMLLSPSVRVAKNQITLDHSERQFFLIDHHRRCAFQVLEYMLTLALSILEVEVRARLR